ncbi:ATP-dependent zinc metalloprotease FtsH [Planctomycetes bacterium Pan216]|uniref:ATP-dependent zinc metalloprotease FtsH n=1 Tax=Kolteria novifilia TaxID=2527975 RepID=A0A518BCN2_9BACT|nr:ATP-dependent zinc metalloprotease FtsH [Planctomycetes bacterium Pan216]
MADDSPDGNPLPSSRSPQSPQAGKSETARGPRIPRGLIVIVVFCLLAILVVGLASDKGRTITNISFTKFQSHWSEKEKRYLGFDQGELREDALYVRPTQVLAATPKEAASKEDASTKTDAKAKSKLPDDRPMLGFLEKRELWYRVYVPPYAIDYEFLERLGTIEDFKYDPGNPMLRAIVWYALSLGVLVGIFYFLFLRPLRSQNGPGNVLSFGRSRPKLIQKEHTNVRFPDVAGIDEAKEEVGEVIEFLKNPEKFQGLGGRIPRGLLFAGPPGTGKTLLAKAIAGEADVPFYSICGSDFVEMFVGVGASRVRDLFRQAKETTPCIIFLDEVDAVGRRRGSGLGGGHDEREQTLNAILVEMDGFETNEQVIVIASTNRPDVLDPALLRPGRFDREIMINLPDLPGRYQILKVHARHVKMSDEVDLMRVARGTPMFSGADLAALVNEAAIMATMAGKKSIEQDDLEEARDKVCFGREKRSRVLDQHDREVTAYHEAGHAMLTRLLPNAQPLHKVTIIPRGMSLGSTMSLPEKDRYTISRAEMIDEIQVLFGGRIAEEIYFNDISSGARNDIERASDMARKMVCEYGMSDELGPILYLAKEQQVFLGGEVSKPREFSEATAEKIDQAVRRIIDSCYADATQALKQQKDETELVAKALLKYETLSAEEIEKLLRTGDLSMFDYKLPAEAKEEESEQEADSDNEIPEGETEPATSESSE